MASSTVPTSSRPTEDRAGAGPTLVLRADSRPGVGFGHVVRCGALAGEWVNAGGRAAMVVDRLDETLEELLPAGADVDVIAVSDPLAVDEFLAAAARFDADWAVVDGYGFSTAFETAVRHAGYRLLVIDDYASRSHDADIVLDQNLGSDAAAYASSRRLVGPRFGLLRSTIRTGSRRADDGSLQPRIVVSVGGSPRPAVVALVDTVVRHFEGLVDVIGPGFSDGDGEGATFHGVIADPTELLARSDLALSASGSTAWELCHLGVPSVLVSVADNQVGVGDALARAGAAEFMGSVDAIDADAVVSRMEQLLADPKRREQMAAAGRDLVDGKGARRVVGEMISDLLCLRAATEDDLELLHLWANDDAVRSSAFKRGAIEWGEHVAWFGDQLADPGSIQMIGLVGDQPVGQIRFNSDTAAGVAVVSVSLDAAWRGYGLGRAIIEAASEVCERESIAPVLRALVKDSNQSSRRAFEAAGFELVDRGSSDGDDYVVYERVTG